MRSQLNRLLNRLLILVALRGVVPAWRDMATGRKTHDVEPCGHAGCEPHPRPGSCVWL